MRLYSMFSKLNLVAILNEHCRMREMVRHKDACRASESDACRYRVAYTTLAAYVNRPLSLIAFDMRFVGNRRYFQIWLLHKFMSIIIHSENSSSCTGGLASMCQLTGSGSRSKYRSQMLTMCSHSLGGYAERSALSCMPCSP